MSAEVFDQMVEAVEGLIRRSISPLADELRAIDAWRKSVGEIKAQEIDTERVVAEVIAKMPPPAPGRDGRDGSCFVVGEGPPLVAGRDGDVYLDSKTGDLYKCR